MKKILNIIAQKPSKTGSGIYVQSLIKEADKKNYKQSIVCGINHDDEPYSFDTKNPVQFYPIKFKTEELPFPVIGMSDVMPYESTKYSDLTEDMLNKWKKSFASVLKKAIDEFKPDIIFCHHLWILTALVKDLFPTFPVIAFCHGTDLRQLKTFKALNSQLHSSLLNYVINNCRKVETIIASHESEKNDIIKNYSIENTKIKIAGTGFNPDVFYMDTIEKKYNNMNIIFAGKLSFSKGVLSLLKSVDNLKNDKINLYLAGSGDGIETKTILNLCKNKYAHNNIHILGSLSQKELGNIFRKCDLLVLPSFYEGLPLVLIEALACGLKVVCTDLPGIREWMGKVINNSGLIEYVNLPRIKNIDTPFEEDIPLFELKLQEAINHQINSNVYLNEEVAQCIKSKSWEGAFSDIEELFIV